MAAQDRGESEEDRRILIDSPDGLQQPRAAGTFEIELTPAEPFAPGGSYRIEVVSLADASPEQETRLQAELLMSEAASLSDEATGASQRRAVDLYLQPRDKWRKLGITRREAESLHGAAALSAYLGDSQGAVDRYREASALWERGGHEVFWLRDHRSCDAPDPARCSL